METGAYFEEGSNPAINIDDSVGRFGYLREDLQEGTFSCAVATDNPNNLTTPDPKRYIFKCPY